MISVVKTDIKKKKSFPIILILFLSLHNTVVYSQELKSTEFLKLSLEDQLKTFFDTYRDGNTAINFPRFASYIVIS